MARRAIARRTLIVCLAGSVVAHAAILVVMPQLVRDPEPARSVRLEVVILQPEPLPLALPEFSLPSVRRESQPQRRAVVVEPLSQTERQLPIESPEPRLANNEIVAPTTKAPESAGLASAQKAMVVTTAVTLLSVSAAYLSYSPPRYPPAARRAGEQGTVTLRVLVTREGSAGRVEIEKPSGSPYLDAAAQEAVKAWSFTPARNGAETIESWMLVPIVFRLEGG